MIVQYIFWSLLVLAYLFIGAVFGGVTEYVYVRVGRNPQGLPVTRGERLAFALLFPVTYWTEKSLHPECRIDQPGMIGVLYHRPSNTCDGYVPAMTLLWPLKFSWCLFVSPASFILRFVAHFARHIVRSASTKIEMKERELVVQQTLDKALSAARGKQTMV